MFIVPSSTTFGERYRTFVGDNASVLLTVHW